MLAPESTRAQHLSTAEHFGNFGVADSKFIDMTNVSLPTSKGAGCVLKKDVLPDRMESCYADPSDTNLLRSSTDLELKLNKGASWLKQATTLQWLHN